ncbi:hypothetical protein [uncultured Sneathiella sp.]|uniref:hypothetical protein n=1 Tax=uncultured Sneathiella sp. TaxID=879315 RepID=UPI00259873C6|nr:hypothetical protein [uncultured Sneathiella sp.]
MNEPFLILQGTRAASWLAMRGYSIGLASPARYDQGEDGEILKVNHQLCVVKGQNITSNIEKNWQKSTPDGIVLHRPRPAHGTLLDGLLLHDS